VSVSVRTRMFRRTTHARLLFVASDMMPINALGINGFGRIGACDAWIAC
jgi:hypothetical protein